MGTFTLFNERFWDDKNSYFRYKCAKLVILAGVQFVTRAKRGWQKHPCNDDPFRSRVSNSIFHLSESVKLAFLFVLRARSNCFSDGVRESKLICACATFTHAVCKTATLRTQNKHKVSSFAHSAINNIFLKSLFHYIYWKFMGLLVHISAEWRTFRLLKGVLC